MEVQGEQLVIETRSPDTCYTRIGEVAAGFMTLSDTAKWIAVIGMLLGRLEIFTLLVLVTPTFWRH